MPLTLHSVGRGWWICEFEVGLDYLVSSVNEFSLNEFSSESLSLRMMRKISNINLWLWHACTNRAGKERE